MHGGQLLLRSREGKSVKPFAALTRTPGAPCWPPLKQALGRQEP